ncbi:MAG: LysR family transcriptional regulator [Clostridiales bacterium]|nr:LysR family transcriptional regulator [Clostridiales bacterium]
MTFRQIEYALELSKTLSFSKAAEALYISQPALSRQIQNLEQELGVTLFERTRQGLLLTKAGALFCQDMRLVCSRANETISRVRNCNGVYSDTLRIGLPDHFRKKELADNIKAFMKKYPEILLDIQCIKGSGRLDAFLRRELDVIFFPTRALEKASGVTTEVCRRSHIYCVVDSENPLAEKKYLHSEELAGQRVFIHANTPIAELARAQERLISTVPVNVQPCGNLDVALFWLSLGEGVALVPGFCYSSFQGFAWIPYDFKQTVDYSIACHKDDTREAVRFLTGLVLDSWNRLEAQPDVIV